MQLLEPGNIDLTKRPRVKNPDGTISTVRSISINQDGKEILIPTVAEDGSRILSNDEAVEQFRRTGHHLGKFDSIESANKYAEQLHNSEAKKIMPIKIRGQNGVYEMPWDKPGEPSSQDIDAFLAKVEPPSSGAPKAEPQKPSLWERANTPLTTAPSRLANRI